MKKQLAGILFVCILFSFCACSSEQKGVPDDVVQLEIANEFDNGNYTTDIRHKVDTSTHLDYVEVDIKFHGDYCIEHYTGNAEYRYNKANDYWDIYSSFDWEHVKREYKPSAYIGIYDGTDFSSGAEYNLNITSIDFEKREITGKFHVKESKLFLGGYSEIAELDVNGTYPFSIDSDGFDLKIEDSNYVYRFSFNQYGLRKVWSNYVG